MKKLYRNYVGLFYFGYFAIGSFSPLLATYLKSIGMNGTQIGTILSTAAFISIFFPPIWGMLNDRTQKTKEIITIVMLFSIGIALVLTLIKSYYLLILGFATLYIFHSAVGPIIETMALHSSIDFGKIRQWGAIGFAMAVLISGFIADNFGLFWIFIIYGIAYIFALYFIKPIQVEKHEVSTSRLEGISTLFKNKKYMLFLISSFFINGSISANNTYFGLLYEYIGGSITGVGIAFLLFAGSEAPFMKWTYRFINRWGIENILIFSSTISMLRWVWYSTSPSPLIILAFFIIQGISVGIFLISGPQFIAKNTSKDVKSTAMTLYGSVGMGMGGMVTKFTGGVIYEYLGIDKLYIFLTIFTLIGIIPLLIIKYKK